MQLSAFRICVRVPVDVAVIKLCSELLLGTRSTMNVCERLSVFAPAWCDAARGVGLVIVLLLANVQLL